MKRIKPAILAITGLLAAALIYFSATRPYGEGTTLELEAHGQEGGFERETTLVTQPGMTRIAFTGELSVGGSATVLISAQEDGSVAYEKTYEGPQALGFTVDGLTPDSHYTLRFFSDEPEGYLLLETNQRLAKQPDRPARPPR